MKQECPGLGTDGGGEPPFLSRLTAPVTWESTVRLLGSPSPGRIFLCGLSYKTRHWDFKTEKQKVANEGRLFCQSTLDSEGYIYQLLLFHLDMVMASSLFWKSVVSRQDEVLQWLRRGPVVSCLPCFLQGRTLLSFFLLLMPLCTSSNSLFNILRTRPLTTHVQRRS